MITGKIENKTVWAPLYVMQRLLGHECRGGGVCPVGVCGSAQVNKQWSYFALKVGDSVGGHSLC